MFAQSVLDIRQLIDLVDLVDGMDLSLEWGVQNLELHGTNDVAWAERKSDAIRASVPYTEGSCLLEVSAACESRQETWERTVLHKTDRIGTELPRESYATRFRYKGSEDPRTSREVDVDVYALLKEHGFTFSSNSDVVVVEWQ